MPLSDTQRLLRKAKESERTLGRFLMEHDGPDPRMTGIASSTGRVGHITGMQVDVLSKSFAAENKRVKIGKRLSQWWLQINDIAVRHSKDALLRIEPSEGLLGRKVPDMYIITGERLAELLQKEKAHDERQANVLPVTRLDMD